jgi:hypothetical protein
MDTEFIDGNPIVSHVVRFKDRATISETDAEDVKDGAVVVWIVRTRCEPPSYHPVAKDSDDRYRFNIQKVEAAAVLRGPQRDGALAYLDDPTQNQGRFVFESPTFPPNWGPTPVSVEALDAATQEPLPDPDTPERIPIYQHPSPTQALIAEMWDELR